MSPPISFFHRLLPSNLPSSPSLNLLPNEMNRRSKSLPSTLCAILSSLDPLFRRFFSPFDEIKRGASETGCFFLRRNLREGRGEFLNRRRESKRRRRRRRFIVGRLMEHGVTKSKERDFR